jgi:hypothetical protein
MGWRLPAFIDRATILVMIDKQAQAARDAWQTALYEASHRYAVTLRELGDTNPWPEHAILGQAIGTLATELWDRCFSMTEIMRAFHEATASLPHYAAGDEIRR